MRCRPILTVLSLGLAATAPASAGKDPFAFFRDGASAVEVTGSGQVPLLRGVDTDGKPAVLAQGADKDEPDEFLLTMRMADGANHCTKAVVNALGGEINELTLGKQSKGLLKSTVKTVTEAATIPELRLKGDSGEVIIRDWHCEVHKSDNALSVLTLAEVAVAQLTDEGVFAFASAAEADVLLAEVGTPVQGTMLYGNAALIEDTLVARVGTSLAVPGTLFGKPGLLVLSTDGLSLVAGPIVEVPFTIPLPGAAGTSGTAAIGEVTLAERAAFVVFDHVYERAFGETPAADLEVSATLGANVLFDVAIAVDPATGRMAVSKVAEARWKDPGDKLIEDAKKVFDKGADSTASLLAPIGQRVFLASIDPPQTCETGFKVVDRSFQTVDGVRAFGNAAISVEEVPCDPIPVDRVRSRLGDQAAQDESAEAPADSAAGGSGTADDASADSKEAQRLADYADVLWKHGRRDEALDLYDQANGLAGEDCSYFSDFAYKALTMGRTDDAAVAAQRAAELYEPWAAQSVQTRLDVQAGKEMPEGTITKAQSHDCYTARGTQAGAALAKGSHRQVEALYDAHMDLDERLALAVSLSRLQRGQTGRARGPALQALDVGGRGDTVPHLVQGIAATRTGSERLVDANLDRLQTLASRHDTGDLLAMAAMAREGGGVAKVQSFMERQLMERPDAAATWTVYGLEALRRGDTAAHAKVVAVAAQVARDEIDMQAGRARDYCEAASLMAVAGDMDAAQAYRKAAEGRPSAGTSCQVNSLVMGVMAGDAQQTTNALQGLAQRFPFHPLGTLAMVQALPMSKDGSDDGGAE